MRRWTVEVTVALAVLLISACAVGAASSGALPARFGTEGEGAGQLSPEASGPAGIAVDQESGDVYVADRGNNRIAKFGPEGEALLAWGWGVADGTTEALQVCTGKCSKGIAGSGAGQFKGAEGIAVDDDPLSSSHGDVYVVDAGNNRVEKFTSSGEFLLMIGGEVNATTHGDVCLQGEQCTAGVAGAGSGFFKRLTGRSVAVDSSGVLYVGDESRVQRFTAEGAVVNALAFASAGFSENLAVDPAKNIYLKSANRSGVRKYNEAGTEQPPPRDTASTGIRDAIAIAPAEGLFVNDLRAGVHHILAYNAAGSQLAAFDPAPENEDGLRGIAYSTVTKALYVLSTGSVRVVVPPPAGPFVVPASESASELQPTSATLSATINPEGPSATSYRFEYGTTTAYGASTVEKALGGGPFEDRPASAAVTGLTPLTTYHFRVVATNAAAQTTFGPDQTFTTLPPVSIDGTAVSEVDAESARLLAELNPHGQATSYHFEYGTTTAYGTKVPIPDATVGSGSTDVSVGNSIQGLAPSTTYHVRVVAHNALGTTAGPDITFTTQGSGSTLPDGRVWELVSPPNKHGAPLEPITEEGGLIQSAAGGGAFAYVALGPPEESPAGVRSPSDTQLVAKRGASGWSTRDIATPNEEIAGLHVSVPSEYKQFAEDLSAAALEPESATPLSPQTTERTPYRWEESGEFVPLVTAANVPTGAKFAVGSGVQFRDASPDLSHVVLASPHVLTSGFAPGFEGNGEPNLYELTAGNLRLISVLPSGEPMAEAGLGAGVGRNNLSMRGAVSSDGSHVFIEAGRDLYAFVAALGRTVQLDTIQPGAGGGLGAAHFQGASADGSRVFFTDDSRLTPGSTAKPGQPDLYACEFSTPGGSSCALSDLSVDPNPGEAANLQGAVSAFDQAGERIYFAANGVLTSAPNAQGERAKPGNCASKADGSCNLYEVDVSSHQAHLVAVVSSKDAPDWVGQGTIVELGNLTARSSPDGHYFAFMSQRSLTAYDNRDARSAEPDEEVFLFDAQSGALRCVSCNPTGARPSGVFDKEAFPGLLVDHARSWFGKWLAGSIPGWTLGGPVINSALYQSRYLSDSGRMLFNSADSLVAQDKNQVEDVYEYEPPGIGGCSGSSSTYSAASGGCVGLISSGSSKEESAFLDASESGSEVFFLTASRLVKRDIDAAFDVYDAHVCSADSPCPPEPPEPSTACEGDSCQNPAQPPNAVTPSSLTYKGPGNAAPPAPPAHAKAKPPTRAQLLSKALKACKRKPKKKRAACERQARKKYGPKHQAKSGRARTGSSARGARGGVGR